MSTGESDYAKRVVEMSMQLANSRADVENLRMRIKAVDKEHEQLKKDRADMVDRFDAALRRAKAEGVRELVGHEQLAIQILDALERGGYLVSGPDGEEIGLTILDEADKFLDARAAQIEQGEEHGH